MIQSSESPPGVLGEAIKKADPMSRVRDGKIPGPAGYAEISHGHEGEGWPEHLLMPGKAESGKAETADRPE